MSIIAPKRHNLNTPPDYKGLSGVGSPRAGGNACGPRPGEPVLGLETKETSSHVPLEEKREQRRVRAGRQHATTIRSLRACGRDEEANDLQRCNKLVVYECGGCGERSGRVYFTCKNRSCTYCLRARAQRISESVADIVANFGNPVIVVFTIKNRKSLVEADAHLRESFSKLVRRAAFKKHFVGGFCFWEATYNRFTGEWHVHMHCLMDGRMPKNDLQDLWFDCTGDSYIVHISFIKPENRRAAVVEACKYPCKLASIVDMPNVLDEYLTFLKGRRLWWAFGSCYGLQAQVAKVEEAEEYEELVEDSAICPSCGTIGEMSHVRDGLLFRGQCYPTKHGWWIQARSPDG